MLYKCRQMGARLWAWYRHPIYESRVDFLVTVILERAVVPIWALAGLTNIGLQIAGVIPHEVGIPLTVLLCAPVWILCFAIMAMCRT